MILMGLYSSIIQGIRKYMTSFDCCSNFALSLLSEGNGVSP